MRYHAAYTVQTCTCQTVTQYRSHSAWGLIGCSSQPRCGVAGAAYPRFLEGGIPKGRMLRARNPATHRTGELSSYTQNKQTQKIITLTADFDLDTDAFSLGAAEPPTITAGGSSSLSAAGFDSSGFLASFACFAALFFFAIARIRLSMSSLDSPSSLLVPGVAPACFFFFCLRYSFAAFSCSNSLQGAKQHHN